MEVEGRKMETDDGEGRSGEELNANNNGFLEKSIRLQFIRKVYAILSVMLIVTTGLIAVFVFVEPVRDFSRENKWLMYTLMGVSFCLILVIACNESVRRNYPTNFILLILFTFCEGITVAYITSFYKRDEVLLAFGITAVVTISLTIFALQTKWDFTMYGGILFVCVIVLILASLLCVFFPSRILQMVLSALGALIFACYLVVDTQMMMGGKHKFSISPEEYIFAALNLFLDIINMFLYILQMIGLVNSTK